MNSVHLNRALMLEDKVTTSDGAGGLLTTWEPLGTLWAHVDGSSGREGGSLGVARSQVQLRITVRGAPYGTAQRPRPEQRFREGARVYRIEAVTETDPKGRYLTCFAIEEVVV